MRHLLLISVLLALSACATTDNTGNAEFGNVAVSFATQGPTIAPSVMANDTIAEGGDELVITRAEVVVRDIELRRVEQTDCSTDACEEFEAGPVLVDLPLGPSVEQLVTVDIPPGSYNRIEFTVHKPEDNDSTDLAFIAANPDFERISIRVQGTWNGQAFTFTTDLNESQELVLSPVLEIIDETSSTNLTILIDIRTWFRDAAGALVNPDDANKGGTYENVVRDRIRNSIDAFRDHDHDGGDDS